jgi:hypothetical protein
VIKGRSDQKSFLTVRDVVIRDVITSHRIEIVENFEIVEMGMRRLNWLRRSRWSRWLRWVIVEVVEMVETVEMQLWKWWRQWRCSS